MKLRYIFTFLFICLLGLIAYSINKKLNKTNNTPSDILVVSTVKAYPHEIKENFMVTGFAIARDEISVFTELPNVRIKELFVDAGNYVQKGQKLAILDDESLQLQLKITEAELNRAKDALNRLEPLKGSGTVSEMSIEEAKSSYQSALARVEDVRLSLRRSIITAPEEGMIFERRVNVGDFGKANEPLFKIAKKNIIEALLRVPEGRIHQISLEQIVQLKLIGSEKECTGKVRIISPQIDPVTRVASVRVQIENAPAISIGSFINGTIQLQTIKGFALPYTALQQNQKGNFVWLVDSQNKVIAQEVTLLLLQDKLALIKDLSLSANVIAKAGSFVKAGDEVKIAENPK